MALHLVGDIAQLVELQTENLAVGGSNPSIPTILWSLYIMCRYLAADVRSPGTLLLPAASLRDLAAVSF